MTWWTFDETSGVLEFDAPELELHWQLMGGSSFAWWCDDRGRLLGIARVGQA
jgi:hypothetical protein